jgi:hypothetical protein
MSTNGRTAIEGWRAFGAALPTDFKASSFPEFLEDFIMGDKLADHTNSLKCSHSHIMRFMNLLSYGLYILE